MNNSTNSNRQKLLGLICCLIVAATCYTLFLQSCLSFPSLYRVSVGEPISLAGNLPRPISADISFPFDTGGSPPVLAVERSGLTKALSPGSFHLDLRLFGLIPLKRVTLQVLPPVRVMVGGQSIGVLLHSNGVVVVGISSITGADKKERSPGQEAGINKGDLILKIENIPVQSDAQVSFLIDRLARTQGSVTLEVKHGGVLKKVKLKPIYCQETKRYRIGLSIRDGAAGVGTLTFFDPTTKRYGALGHLIANSETNQSLDLKDGKIVSALINGITRGERGKIGEKVGLFFSNQQIIGNITKNTPFGIFGNLTDKLANPLYPNSIPVAMGHQIREGPAQILTVLDGNRIESFQVEIQRLFPQSKRDGKSFIIKVTDPKLLQKTGGIVQGMSGSPVIQNNKLVGAVTHVFINDPTRGYGVLAEMMLEEAGILGGGRRESGLPFYLGSGLTD